MRLLLTPDEAGGVSRLMHTFARNYAGLIPHRCYLALRPDRAALEAAYRRLFDEALPAALVAEIRQYQIQEKRGKNGVRFT